MPPAFIQVGELVQDANPSVTLATAYPFNVTAGSLLIASLVWQTAGADESANSCIDLRGNTWIRAQHIFQGTSNQDVAEFWYALNPTSGPNTVTVTIPTARAYRGMIVAEYTGLAASAPLDVSVAGYATTTSLSTDATTGPVLTTTVDGDLIIETIMFWNKPDNIGVGTGATERLDAGHGHQLQDLIQTTHGARTSAWTFGVVGYQYMTQAAAFKVAGGGTALHRGMLLGVG